MSRRFVRFVAVLLLGCALLAACSSSDSESAAFCDKLTEVTGPAGVESLLAPGNPARVDGVADELDELHSLAPERISATTRTLVTFFEEYQKAPRDERRSVIADNERLLADAALSLNDFALVECGLFLDRIPPTPVPTANPAIEAQAD